MMVTTTKTTSSWFWLIVVNLISASRIATPFIIFLGYYPAVRNGQVGTSVWWLVAIALLTATDGIDGWIARHFNATSKLGSILDHATDKLSLGAALVAWIILIIKAPTFGDWSGVVGFSVASIVIVVAVELVITYLNLLRPELWDQGANQAGRDKYKVQGLALAIAGVGLTWFYHHSTVLAVLLLLASVSLLYSLRWAWPSLKDYRHRLTVNQ